MPDSLTVPGPVGPLQAEVDWPRSAGPSDELAAAPQGVAVLCHPHPLYGGSMTNKVVVTAARAFNDRNRIAVRFNFRGVGASAGSYDEGRGESDDALSVVAHVRKRWPNVPLWLAGFSFGAYVALRIVGAIRPRAQGLIVIAPPVARWDFTPLAAPEVPWAIIHGEQDELVSAEIVRSWNASLPRPAQLTELAGATHFFHGLLLPLREQIVRFQDSVAGGSSRSM
jgi:uncharacterized protein